MTDLNPKNVLQKRRRKLVGRERSEGGTDKGSESRGWEVEKGEGRDGRKEGRMVEEGGNRTPTDVQKFIAPSELNLYSD